jgi:putative Ca2+/H+ antiporter (TMEM165/GDT1 family)
MILVSEMGDETFIIAAIMAMRHPRFIVLAGALSALAVMTVLSTALGLVVPNLISKDTVGGLYKLNMYIPDLSGLYQACIAG